METQRPTMEELDQLPEFQDDEEEYEDEFPEGFEDDEEEDEIPEPEIPEAHDHDLSLEEILSAEDDAEESVYIKEWGGKITIRGLSKREFDFMRKQATRRDARGKRNDIYEMEIILAGVVKPVISRAAYQQLQDKSAGVLVHILNEIYRKSGLEREAERARERRFPKK